MRALARAQGALKFLHRNVDPFLAVGNSVKTALIEGRREDARRLMRDFERFEDFFGPDLDELRRDLVSLTDRSAKEIWSDERANAWFSFALFLVASAVGLGISGVGSGRVVSALRNLLTTTREVEAGRMDVTVPVVTRDEVGELARAFNRMIVEIRQRERIKDTFGKFVDPRIVTRLTRIERRDARAGRAARRDDLLLGYRGLQRPQRAAHRGGDGEPPQRYFTGAGEVIHARHGMIDKYIGDSVMAFWTTPFSTGDEHVADACLAALEQQEALAEFRRRIPEITGLRRDAPRSRCGWASRRARSVVGTLGSPSARSFTVIGDTVNLASRLEGVNKAYGTGILIAEDTFRLAQSAVEAREIDLVLVAGKTEPIRIYELLSPAGQLDATRAALRDRFSEALAAYRRREWDEAMRLFEAAREIVPDDKPSAIFLARIAQLREAALLDTWDGVWRLTSK